MFDTQTYSIILQAMQQILGQNMHRLGRDFCEGLMTDYDHRNGYKSQQNATNLFDLITREAQKINNGTGTSLTNDQLFAIVGSFIEHVYGLYLRNQQQQRGGFGGGSSMFGNSGGSSMFGNQSRGGFGQLGGGGMFGQSNRTVAGSHLGDVVEPLGQQRQTTQAQPAAEAAPAPSKITFPQSESAAMIDYKTNPLDDLSDQGVEFSAVKTKPLWGSEKAKDRRIIISRRRDMKTRDSRFTVNATDAYHQLILNDPMEVMKDFFAIVPDSTLGAPFVFKIIYHHLDVVDVPTRDFVEVRDRCIEEIAKDSGALLHKKIAEVLVDMKQGSYKALTGYLVEHVNRALHLASRLSTDPAAFIRIGGFEDIDELLSSSFTHPFTTLPEGRHKLEKIVGGALWNALVMNANVMFADQDRQFPTHAVQASPAFPFSMEGVYPNKFSIPTENDSMMEKFREHLEEKELSRRTYVLSRRSVVVTNIFGRKVLPKIGSEPSVIDTPLGPVINSVSLPYTMLNPDENDVMQEVTVALSEDYPSNQLEAYYDNPQRDEQNESDRYDRMAPVHLPLDQTVFAIQLGVSPKQYMMAIDVFTTLDDNVGQGQTVLAKKKVPMLTTTA